LFGSRANGTYKPRSDFDIGIQWEKKIPAGLFYQIQDRLQTIPTLKKIDLVDLYKASTYLKDVVISCGKELYGFGKK
jgi:predicted nucleotidyltransferase